MNTKEIRRSIKAGTLNAIEARLGNKEIKPEEKDQLERYKDKLLHSLKGSDQPINDTEIS